MSETKDSGCFNLVALHILALLAGLFAAYVVPSFVQCLEQKLLDPTAARCRCMPEFLYSDGSPIAELDTCESGEAEGANP